MSAVTDYPQLSVEDSGVARITDTRYKVEHLAAEHYYHGWTAEELLRQHPDLRPDQVYASLAYFYEHYQEIIDRLKDSASLASAESINRTFSREELLKRSQARGH